MGKKSNKQKNPPSLKKQVRAKVLELKVLREKLKQVIRTIGEDQDWKESQIKEILDKIDE